MKQISSKRNKTDADYEEMARIEFMSGLYMTADGPVIPTDAIDAMLIAAAKKSKEGTIAKSGIFCAGHAQLDYAGPRAVDELWADDRFRLTKRVRVGTASVMRTRPKFDEWQAIVSFNYEPTLINPSRIDDWMVVAGSQVGLLDWRPQYGRFGVERLNGV